MIHQLSIINYAIIEQSVIHFSTDFSVITGETGAGKSILLDALGLILGQRADMNALRNKDEKCIIEGVFDISNYGLVQWFEENDMDYDEQTIIRREILPSGKSRAFVNDTPTSLAILQQLGGKLIHIHSQHQTQELFEEKHQMQLLDGYAETQKEKDAYIQELALYKKHKAQLEVLEEQQAQLTKDADYYSFLYDELQAVRLKENEEELLNEEAAELSNVEKTTEHLSAIYQIFSNEEFGVYYQLREVKNHFNKLLGTHPKYDEWISRVDSSLIELQDLADEVEQKLELTIADPERLDEVYSRIQTIQNLYKKHQVQHIEELLAIQQNLAEKVENSETIGEEIEKQRTLVQKQKEIVEQSALVLSEKRKQAIPDLVELMQEQIRPLGMPYAVFVFDLSHSEIFLNDGMDKIQIQFSANKGMPLGILKKTASGGELSRIMLVIQSIMAKKLNLPTIIFDEIDTGVSGEIANKMGEIMKQMAAHMQILAITHLPQVAAKGHQHYKVYKHDQEERTTSEIRLLDAQKRVEEIAQMISGTTITKTALKQAENLIK